MEQLGIDDYVVDKNGRTGLIVKKYPKSGQFLIKYGADGPFKTYKHTTLRRATVAEREIATGERLEVDEVMEIGDLDAFLDEIDEKV